RQPRHRSDLGDSWAALRVARRHYGKQIRKSPRQLLVRLNDRGFLARMGGCGGDDGATREGLARELQLVGVGLRCRDIELDVACGDNTRRAEIAKALRVGRRACQTQVEPPQQPADSSLQIGPALE